MLEIGSEVDKWYQVWLHSGVNFPFKMIEPEVVLVVGLGSMVAGLVPLRASWLIRQQHLM